MPVVPDKDIQSALNNALALAFPTTPIAWENTKYIPTVGTHYFRVWLLPAETDMLTIGTKPVEGRQGIFQVSIFYPIEIGFGLAKAKAAEVVAAFSPHSAITYNTLRILIEKAWPSIAIPTEEGWYQIPVSIRYQCYYQPV